MSGRPLGLDRKYDEILQELRVAQNGVQILFAFLLGMVFSQRFAQVGRFDRTIYFVTLLCATVAAAGMGFLAVSIIGAVKLVTDVLFGRVAGGVTAAALAMVFCLLWVVVPLRIRARRAEDEA